MIHYSDGAIVEGLRLRSDLIIRYIYQELFPMIKYLVMSNNGNEEDAEDIFQDGLVIFGHTFIPFAGIYGLRS